jgi:hypothetical protein
MKARVRHVVSSQVGGQAVVRAQWSDGEGPARRVVLRGLIFPLARGARADPKHSVTPNAHALQPTGLACAFALAGTKKRRRALTPSALGLSRAGNRTRTGDPNLGNSGRYGPDPADFAYLSRFTPSVRRLEPQLPPPFAASRDTFGTQSSVALQLPGLTPTTSWLTERRSLP